MTFPTYFYSIGRYEIKTELRMDRADTAKGKGGGLLIYATKESVKGRQVKFHQAVDLFLILTGYEHRYFISHYL
jgi:hypothetical protein